MESDVKSRIEKAFPLVNKIKDTDMRNKVIEAWAKVWNESGYTNLEDAYQRGSGQDMVVRHTNSVTNAAYALALQFQEEYGISVDFDLLLAGAILHDIDKIMIFEKNSDGKVDYSEFGKKLPHGSYGGHIALEVGLPIEVANLIITHTPLSTWEPINIEGVFIHHADSAKFKAYEMAMKSKQQPA